MKQLLSFFSLILCVGMHAHALPSVSEERVFNYRHSQIALQDYPGTPSTVLREINPSEVYQQIKVQGDVKVILMNGPSNRLILHGDSKDLSLVKTTIKKGKLVIHADRKQITSRLTVYVPVSGVASMEINGSTEVFSSGTIEVQNLHLILNGNSSASINYSGKLTIAPGSGYALVDEKPTKTY